LIQKKRSKKNQDCACLAQKTYVQKAKTPKLAALRVVELVAFESLRQRMPSVAEALKATSFFSSPDEVGLRVVDHLTVQL
jgi:CRISPR/Cas system Type II protein with McrA/HNH and RuvC-like nuclease domain